MIIYHVGMPGSGKSTVGRHLARQLGVPFVDSDHEIESRIGMPIRDYFAAQGEPAFRDLEEQVLGELTARDGIVLATGGGAVLRQANRDALRARTTSFYLRSSPEEIFRFTANVTRCTGGRHITSSRRRGPRCTGCWAWC